MTASYIPGISATGELSPGLTPAAVRAVLELLSSAEIAAAYLPLAGGTISGELFIASGGALYLYDPSTEADVQLSVDDGELLVGNATILDNNSTLNASNLGFGTVSDNRLSSNVPLKNAANTFSGTITVGGTAAVNLDLRNASNVQYANFNGTARSFFAGGDAFAVLIDGTSRLYNNGVLAWNSGSVASSGTIDVSIRRNATGPTLETRAASGARICNADGSALAAIECSQVSSSVAGIVIGHSTQGWTPSGPAKSHLYSHQGHWALAYQGAIGTVGAPVVVGGHLGFAAASSATSAVDTRMVRASAGVISVLASTSTADSTTLGSLNLANLTASAGSTASPSVRFGTDTNSGIYQAAANTVSIAASGSELLRVSNGSIVYCFASVFNAYNDVMLGSSGGPRLRNNAGALRVTNNAGSADGDVQCANITASGGITFGPRTKAALLATSATATAGCWRITDSTPAQRIAYPDGTNWRYLSDDTVVT